jgi:hypothetical protein
MGSGSSAGWRGAAGCATARPPRAARSGSPACRPRPLAPINRSSGSRGRARDPAALAPTGAPLASLGAHQAYFDGELCGVGPDGITSFRMIQNASDTGNAAGLVFFLFDLLYLDGDDVSARPLPERKERL